MVRVLVSVQYSTVPVCIPAKWRREGLACVHFVRTTALFKRALSHKMIEQNSFLNARSDFFGSRRVFLYIQERYFQSQSTLRPIDSCMSLLDAWEGEKIKFVTRLANGRAKV